jgi:exodeoxyribonuclease VII small subunit
MSDQVKSDDLSFGEALQELEGIVGQLEGGQLELEQSLDKYQRGVELLKSLQGKLSDAQQKVTMLIGELEEEAAATDSASPEPPAAGGTVVSSEEIPF